MSWKKNWFSYLTWFIYAITTGCVLAWTAGKYCAEAGIAFGFGILAAAVFLLLVGNIVFLMKLLIEKTDFARYGNSRAVHILEAVAAAAILLAGAVVRLRGIESAGQTSLYYDAARVAAGQQLPRLVHGAAYFYVLLLRGVFLLLGNHFIAGLYMQIFLQFTAFCFICYAVRRIAGSAAGLLVLGFCVWSPSMVQNTLVLSPEALFLCVFAAAVLMILGPKGKAGPEIFFLYGILCAFCTYADAAGILLLLLSILAVFSCVREPLGAERRIWAVLLCILGFFIGFFAMVSIDAHLSDKAFGSVLRAWQSLYIPGDFQITKLAESFCNGPEGIVLPALMSFGIFSFWNCKQEEGFSGWIILAGAVAAAVCFGIFTDEMPGKQYLNLFMAVLAGIGFGQCFGKPKGEGAVSGSVQAQVRTADREILIKSVDAGISGETGVRNKPEPEAAEKTEIKVENKDKKQIHYIENPLPLPKKHQKRILDYPVQTVSYGDDFDYPVSEEDDYDI